MSAISFDIDTKSLQAAEHASISRNARDDVRRVFGKHRPTRQKRSVHFGDDTVASDRSLLSVQEPRQADRWSGPWLRDIRILRIQDKDDPLPAVDAVTATD